MLIAERSPTIPWTGGPGVTRFSRTAGAKNLKCDQFMSSMCVNIIVAVVAIAVVVEDTVNVIVIAIVIFFVVIITFETVAVPL